MELIKCGKIGKAPVDSICLKQASKDVDSCSDAAKN